MGIYTLNLDAYWKLLENLNCVNFVKIIHASFGTQIAGTFLFIDKESWWSGPKHTSPRVKIKGGGNFWSSEGEEGGTRVPRGGLTK